MTWTVGKFHTSPGVQPPEAEEGPFYLAAVPSSAEGRWWCPHGWDADGRLCPEKRWLTKNEEAPKVTPQPRPARPEGFIPPQGPLAECQNCGNFPVPTGSPVAELIDTLQTLLQECFDIIDQGTDEHGDNFDGELLARINRVLGNDEGPEDSHG